MKLNVLLGFVFIFAIFIVVTFYIINPPIVMQTPVVKLEGNSQVVMILDPIVGRAYDVGASKKLLPVDKHIISGKPNADSQVILTPLPDLLYDDNLLPLSIVGGKEGGAKILQNQASNDGVNDLIGKGKNAPMDVLGGASNNSMKARELIKEDVSIYVTAYDNDKELNITVSTLSDLDVNNIGSSNVDNISNKIEISSVWTIKGAKADSAVIYNSATKETRSIEVGDAIQGVGNITSIDKVDEKWLIVGSVANIAQ